MNKRIFYKLSLTSALALLLLYGCTYKADFPNIDKENLRFSADIVESVQTRINENGWEINDAAGLFAKSAGEPLSATSIIGGIDNVKLVYSGNYFEPAAGEPSVHYPSDGSRVDFIAYYPYKAASPQLTIPIDLSNQNDLGNIDLLYSKNAVNLNYNSSGTPDLTFRHQLSRLLLNIESADGSDLQNLSVSISGVKRFANFSLADETLSIDNLSTGAINANISVNKDKAKAEAILLPVADITGIVVIITANTKTYTLDLIQDTEITSLSKGRSYSYNVKLTGLGANIGIAGHIEWPVTPDNLFTEGTTQVTHTMPASWLNQSYTTATEYVRNYTILYSTQYKVAHWVAYPLYQACFKQPPEINDDWDYDPIIPRIYQPNLLSTWVQYPSYNRGHQIPSADRTSTEEANKTTYYFSNQTPQNPYLNGGQWSALEEKVRTWAKATDTLYVVTGIILPKPPDVLTFAQDKSGNDAVIPKAYYKALAKKVGGQYYTIGYRMDNRQFSESFENFRVTVASLEQETGLTFFPNITDAAIKSSPTNSPVWN